MKIISITLSSDSREAIIGDALKSVVDWVDEMLLVHLVDPAVALDAADAAVHVDRVVEIDIVRRLVDPDPGHRVARLIAVPDHRQQGWLAMDIASYRLPSTSIVSPGCGVASTLANA